MAQRPAALGIEQRVKVRLAFVEQLAGAKAVEPQQPIRLIESVLAEKRRLGIERRLERIFHHRHIGRVENTLEVIGVIERLREI